MKNGGQQVTTNCDSLEIFLPSVPDSSSLCSSGIHTACSSGDLTAKHGTIQLDTDNGVRMVVTDPYLPLSGPDSAIGNLLLIKSGSSSQYIAISNVADSGGQQDAVSCIGTTVVSTTEQQSSSSLSASLSSSAVATSTSENYGLPLPFPIFLAVCVGGFLVLAILLVAVLVVIVCCAKRRNRYSFEEYTKGKTSTGIELGMYKRSNPVYGIATYKVLYDYVPQADGDLELKEGDMVTLTEAPAGGDWWKGKVGDKEGWFPKTYVNYIDTKAEEKKKKEAEIERVEAMIKAYTIAGNRMSTLDIDSTPIQVTKFNEPLKESTIPETPPESHPGTPLTATKHKPADIVTTTEIVLESPPSSNESLTARNNESPFPSNLSGSTLSPSPTNGESPVPTEDVFIAKFDLVPESESELKLVAGERVIIIERADNGWWHGVVGEQHGWIPETFLQPLATKKEEEAADEGNSVVKEIEEEVKGTDFRPRGMTEFHSETSEEVNVSEYRAIADYTSETEGDLSFNEGDMVLVYWGNTDGWWFGAAGSVQGYFPASYVEPVMEGTSPIPTTPTIVEENESEDDKTVTSPVAAVLDSAVALATTKDSSQPDDGGSLSDQIAAALKKRETISTQQTEQKEEQRPVESQPSDLSSQIAAALKKKQEKNSSSSSIEGLAKDVTVAAAEVKHKSDEQESKVDTLGSDIASMISNMGSKENETVKPSPKTDAGKRPQRKAPPPPGSKGRSKSAKVTNATATKQKKDVAAPPTGTVPVPPPPPPLPAVVPGTVVGEAENEKDSSNNKPESLKRPESPGSTSSTRRKPPAPPSPLTIHKVSEARSPSSPLIAHSLSKSPTPSSPLVKHELSTTAKPTQSPAPLKKQHANDASSKSVSPVPTNVEQKDNVAVRTESSSKWQPQTRNKSSGWKPQTRNNNAKQSAPRREPPMPPPSGNTAKVPKVKVQKVKRPVKNIPPPPSAPLPPPPTKTSSKSNKRPPPVKKVLSGPPPVKKVIGGPQLAPKSPTSPSEEKPKEEEKMANENKITKSEPSSTDPTNLSSAQPAPVTIAVSNVSEASPDTATAIPPVDKTTKSIFRSEKPSVSPKPKIKPAVSPKPKLKPAVSSEPNTKEPQVAVVPKPNDPQTNPAITKEDVVLRVKSKARPLPPERTSSLPNTPSGSPCPSPVPLPRSTSPNASEDLTAQSNKPTPAKRPMPAKPPPPKSVTSPHQDDTTNTEATDGASKDTEQEQNKPSAPPRKKSSTLPPRPAPPKAAKSQETSSNSSVPAPKPRKVSEVGVKVKNLMNPMKTLEARPQRRTQSTSSDDSKKVNDTPATEEEEDKPVPKRRISKSIEDGPPTRKTSVPSRPPPPTTVSKSAVNKSDSLPLSDQKEPPPVAKPRGASSE